MQNQLDRVETALSTLVDSIAAYTPSVPAAQTLLSADSALQDGLKQLHTHQRNHARILQLRKTIDRQDTEITDTVKLLAQTRKDLLEIPTSLPPKGRRDVSYIELLEYAKRISRFTLPPHFRPPNFRPAGNAVAVNGEDVVMTGTKDNKEGVGFGSLQQEEKQWLDPWTGNQFAPWPSEEVIRRSALAQLHAMIERGEDVENAEEEVKGLEKNEDVELQDDEMARGIGEEMSAATRVQREEKPKVFGGLDLNDPDDE